jgi:ribonuclease R
MKMNLENEILSFLDKNQCEINKLARVLSAQLKVDSNTIIKTLKKLESQGDIFEFSKHKYASSKNLGLLKGKIDFNSANFGFVENAEGDIYVSKRNALGAFDGDTVLVKVIHEGVSGKKREGKVLRILSRDSLGIVGTFSQVKSYGFVRPEKKNFDIFIPAGKTLGAHDDDKVVANITNYKSGNPAGEVTEVIGSLAQKGNDIKWLLRQYKVDDVFPENVLLQARSFSQTVQKDKFSSRRDLTKELLFTIDGDDSKDFDDAVSLTKNADGTFLLGVHIADVGEYVRMGSVLDDEAFKRGTSIYFLDQVIPMLPKELSNGICSLNEGQDRLALTVMMKIDTTGEVTGSEIFESIIKSRHRLTYKEVQKIFDGDKDTQKRLQDIVPTLRDMLELSKILQTRRRNCGSLDFDLPEGKVIVDENGKPVDVIKRPSTQATQLIETFMVAANETVAKTFDKKNIPFVYRVHEDPDPDKMSVFYNFLGTLGLKAPEGKKDVEPKDLQSVLKQVDGKELENVVNMVMLRSLKKARYYDQCLGHFGLALQYYCHFTSPIRRYPDLTIHRIIKEFLHHNTAILSSAKMRDFVVKASVQSSNQEKLSEDVERAIEDYKKCEYMSQFVGQNFTGIVSGVNARGFFVELPNTCEGQVSLSSLKDDFYNFDENKLSLVSKHNFYRIGEKVEVKVLSCNLPERKTEFEVVKKVK